MWNSTYTYVIKLFLINVPSISSKAHRYKNHSQSLIAMTDM